MFTNNLQNDIVVKYRVYEIQLPLNFKYKLDTTVCSNFNSYKSLRITACTQKHKGFTDSIASYPKFPWVKDLVFLRTIGFVAIAWGCQITTDTEGCTFSSYTLYNAGKRQRIYSRVHVSHEIVLPYSYKTLIYYSFAFSTDSSTQTCFLVTLFTV